MELFLKSHLEKHTEKKTSEEQNSILASNKGYKGNYSTVKQKFVIMI